MAKKETLNLEVKSNIKSVTKDTDKMADSLEDVNKEAKDGIGNFTLMGVSLNGVKAAFGKVIPMAKAMFGTIKAGIASTGIGLLVIAFGTLVQYFRDSEEGASKFKEITSQVGVVVGNVTDIVSNLGKALFKLITGDISGFKDSLSEATQGMKDFGETTRKEMGMAKQLEKDRLALQKFERKAIVEKARTEKEMMELRLKARDFEKFSAEERLKFMREANKLAGEQLEKDLHVAQEKLRFQIEENSYSKSTQQNLDDEAQLQAAVFNLEKANFSERKRLKSEEQAIVKEIQADEKAAQKAINDAEKLAQKEINDAKKAAQKEIDDAKKKADKKAIDDAKIVADAEIKESERVAKAKKDLDELVAKTKEETIAMGFASAKSLAAEGSALAKAVAVAETIYNTQVGIMAAMKLPPPYNVIQAAITGVMGTASVAKILSTNPEGVSGGGSSGGGGVSSTSAAPPAPEMMSGSFDLTGGQPVEPTRAYVVSDDITNNQNGLEIIRRRATI
jgi:hypothetical protein